MQDYYFSEKEKRKFEEKVRIPDESFNLPSAAFLMQSYKKEIMGVGNCRLFLFYKAIVHLFPRIWDSSSVPSEPP